MYSINARKGYSKDSITSLTFHSLTFLPAIYNQSCYPLKIFVKKTNLDDLFSSPGYGQYVHVTKHFLHILLARLGSNRSVNRQSHQLNGSLLIRLGLILLIFLGQYLYFYNPCMNVTF